MIFGLLIPALGHFAHLVGTGSHVTTMAYALAAVALICAVLTKGEIRVLSLPTFLGVFSFTSFLVLSVMLSPV